MGNKKGFILRGSGGDWLIVAFYWDDSGYLTLFFSYPIHLLSSFVRGKLQEK